jgi:hypothetical protein
MSLAITSTTAAFTVAVTPSGQPLQGNVPSFVNLTVSGATAPVIWAVVSGSLPDGIQLDPAGRLAGIATHRGAALVTLRAVDSTSPVPLFADAAVTVTVS